MTSEPTTARQGIYRLNHRTTYSYSAPVHRSYHVLRLTPRQVERQVVKRHRLLTTPMPDHMRDGIDYFGNPYTLMMLDQDHQELVVTSEGEIEVHAGEVIDLATSLPWTALTSARQGTGSNWYDASIRQFAATSRHGKRIQAAAEYARPSFPRDCPVLVGANDLMRRIYEDFTFDATATDISTPVEQVLKTRRGVCQDFAHLQISALRSLGIPARYVSGYILTKPPEGQPRLQGADASHAWVSVWAPETGWVDFDPTNNLIPGIEHVTIAYGRDYDDVAPIGGVLLGGGAHSVDVGVDLVPL
jgi:transglutaminase-like putative cysteine protease